MLLGVMIFYFLPGSFVFCLCQGSLNPSPSNASIQARLGISTFRFSYWDTLENDLSKIFVTALHWWLARSCSWESKSCSWTRAQIRKRSYDNLATIFGLATIVEFTKHLWQS